MHATSFYPARELPSIGFRERARQRRIASEQRAAAVARSQCRRGLAIVGATTVTRAPTTMRVWAVTR